jgi:hypothetical protein
LTTKMLASTVQFSKNGRPQPTHHDPSHPPQPPQGDHSRQSVSQQDQSVPQPGPPHPTQPPQGEPEQSPEAHSHQGSIHSLRTQQRTTPDHPTQQTRSTPTPPEGDTESTRHPPQRT